MKRPVEIFDSLSDEELKLVVKDLQIQDSTGILPDGPARHLVQRLVAEGEVPQSDAFNLVQREPLRRAAFKWVDA